jgi:hypothetical protein
MYLDAFYSLAIGFAGAILFVLVDKYEHGTVTEISAAVYIYAGDLSQTATIRTCAVLASASAGPSAFPGPGG